MIYIQFSQYGRGNCNPCLEKSHCGSSYRIIRVVITRSVLAIREVIFIVYSNSVKHKVLFVAGSHDSMKIIT